MIEAHDLDREPHPPFERVVCAVDGSAESTHAAREALRISPGTPTTLVYVVDTLDAPSRPADLPAWVHATRAVGAATLAAVRDQLAGGGVTAAVDTTVEEGDVPDALRFLTTTVGDDVLLALGSGEQKELLEAFPLPPATGVRLTERVVEAVTSSVLVARRGTDPDLFPSAITVGVDGSAPSVEAYRVAAAIAERTGADLTVLTALGGKGPDLQALRESTPPIPVDLIEPDHPATALVHAAVDNGLVVVGNRGRHGLRALGSVSARVVARSPSSVLVVRQARKGP